MRDSAAEREMHLKRQFPSGWMGVSLRPKRPSSASNSLLSSLCACRVYRVILVGRGSALRGSIGTLAGVPRQATLSDS